MKMTPSRSLNVQNRDAVSSSYCVSRHLQSHLSKSGATESGPRPVAPFLHQTSQKRNPSQERKGLLPAGLCFATFVRYSHSFTPICCGVIQVNSSWAVGLDCLAAESRRVTSRRRLGQILGQNRKLFRNRKPAVSFLSRGQKRVGFEALKRPI